MSSIFQHILSSILVYRYPALFVISFLSSMGVPLPAAATAVAAAGFAGQGYLNLILVILCGLAGNVVGDLTMYFLIRRFGRRVLRKIGLGKFADSPLLRNVEGAVESYSATLIIASRFQDQATTLVNIISGLGKMKIKRFAMLVTIGDALQMIFYVGVGYLFADNWQAVYGAVGKFGWIIALILFITITVLSTRVIKKHLIDKL